MLNPGTPADGCRTLGCAKPKRKSSQIMLSVAGRYLICANLKRLRGRNLLEFLIQSFPLTFFSAEHRKRLHSSASNRDDNKGSFAIHYERSRKGPSSAVLASAALLRNSVTWDETTEKHLHRLGFPFTSDFIMQVIRNSKDNMPMALMFFIWTERLRMKCHCRYLYDFMTKILIRSRDFESTFRQILGILSCQHVALDTLYKLLIRCYADIRPQTTVLESLKRILIGIKLPGRVYAGILKAWMQEGFAAEAFAIYKETVSSGITLDHCVINHLILGLLNRNMVDEAATTLETMQARRFAPKKTWCLPLVGLLCNRGQTDRAYLILGSILQRADRNTLYLNICVDAFCKSGRVSNAEELVVQSVNWGFSPNTVTFNSLIDGYCKTDRVEKAWFLLDRMQKFGCVPDVISYNTLIQGFNKKMMLLHSLKVFEEMVQSGIHPDVWSYNILMHGFFMLGRTSEANKVVQDMLSRSIVPCTKTYNTILNGLCSIGKVQDAIAFFNELKDFNFNPDKATYNILINGLCGAGKLRDALYVFREAREQGNVPDIITYTTLINCCFRLGQLEMGYSLCLEMKRQGYPPDAFAYSALINGLLKLGRFQEVSVCVAQMLCQGIVLDHAAYNSAINAFFKLRDSEKAFHMLQEMEKRGLVGDAYTNAIVIDGLCKTADVEVAYRHFKTLTEKGHSINLVSYNTLIKGFGRAGKIEKAIDLFKEMHEKDDITYSTLIRALCKGGRILNAYHFLLNCLKHHIDVNESALDAVLASLHDVGYYREARKLKAGIQLNKILRE